MIVFIARGLKVPYCNLNLSYRTEGSVSSKGIQTSMCIRVTTSFGVTEQSQPASSAPEIVEAKGLPQRLSGNAMTLPTTIFEPITFRTFWTFLYFG